MFRSKLFDILSALDDNEYRRFGEFLSSPYYNKSRVLVKLYTVYKKFHPEFKGDKFTKEAIFARLFPDKKFNEVLLRNYNSDLLALAEEFLVVKNFENNRRNHFRHLLNELNSRGINSLFMTNYGNAMRELEGSKTRDKLFNYDRYFIKQEKEMFNSSIRKYSADDLGEREISIINFFFSAMLEMYAYSINHRDVHKINYEFIMLEELIKLAESKKDLLDPVVLIHFNRLMLHHTGEEKYYLLLKEQAEKHGSLTETVNHYDTYICLINYLKKNKDMDSTQTIRELFELRKVIIEKNILTGKNYISNNTFLSQVRSGLKLKEYKWVLEFIEACKERLPENVRNDAYHYSLALYYFERGKFNESLKYASSISAGIYEPLEIRNLFARIYWHLDDFDNIESILISYKQYLAKNRKLDKKSVLRHSGFTGILEKLFRFKYDSKKIDLDQLEKEAGNSAIINNKWLIEVIGDCKRN